MRAWPTLGSKDKAGKPPIGAAWIVFRAALRDTWQDLLTTGVVNLSWLLLNVLVVTGPPATLALFYTTNRVARGEAVGPSDFFRVLPRYFGLAWRWGALQIVALALLAGDIYLSGRLGGDSLLGRLAQGFYVGALAIWVLFQLYVLPFLFEQQEPVLRHALGNGLRMMSTNPVFSIVLGVLVLVALFVGTVLFLLSVAAGGFLVALVGNHAVLDRLQAAKEETP